MTSERLHIYIHPVSSKHDLAGFFPYLTKPIKVNEFMDTLDMALKSLSTGPTSADHEASM